MNVLQITNISGEINSVLMNTLMVNGMGGDAEIIMDSMGAGAAFPVLVIIDFPRIFPRVCVPAETRTAKVGC
jgi:hypothetical protein